MSSKIGESRSRLKIAVNAFRRYLTNAVPKFVISHVHDGPLYDGDLGFAKHLYGKAGVYVLYDGEGNIAYVGKAFGRRGLESRVRHGILRWPVDTTRDFDIDLVECPPQFEFVMCALEQFLIAAFPECKRQKGSSTPNPNREKFR